METSHTTNSLKSNDKIKTSHIFKKLSDLQNRAQIVEEQFKHLSKRASALEEWAGRCTINAENNSKTLGWMQILMKPDDQSSVELCNYIMLLFHLILDHMKEKGIQVSTLSDLCIKLKDDINFKACFLDVLAELGIPVNEAEELELVLNLVQSIDGHATYLNHDKKDARTSPRTPANTPRDEIDLQNLFLNMKIEDDMKLSVEKIIKHAVKAKSMTLTGNTNNNDVETLDVQ